MLPRLRGHVGEIFCLKIMGACVSCSTDEGTARDQEGEAAQEESAAGITTIHSLHELVPRRSVVHPAAASDTPVFEDVDDCVLGGSLSPGGSNRSFRNPLATSGRVVTARRNLPNNSLIPAPQIVVDPAVASSDTRGVGPPAVTDAVASVGAAGFTEVRAFSPAQRDGADRGSSSSRSSTGLLGPCPSTGLIELMSCSSMKDSPRSPSDFDCSRGSRAANRAAGAIPSLECSLDRERRDPHQDQHSHHDALQPTSSSGNAWSVRSESNAELRAAFGTA
jgi:hypothetical protein